MDITTIIKSIDHTALTQTTTQVDVKILIDEAVRFGAASVCIPPCYVKLAKAYAIDKIKICTVIGFPNGYSTTATKVFETVEAIENGATEIDTVINIGFVKSGAYDLVENELKEIKKVCDKAILKVIIEACFLTDEEKIKLCAIVTKVNAEYIKTSTGFANGGAMLDDIVLFKNHIGEKVRIKAAGGIRTIQDADAYIIAGCDRIGSSAIIKTLAKEKS